MSRTIQKSKLILTEEQLEKIIEFAKFYANQQRKPDWILCLLAASSNCHPNTIIRLKRLLEKNIEPTLSSS